MQRIQLHHCTLLPFLMRVILPFVFLVSFIGVAHAQCGAVLNIRHRADIPSVCASMTMTMLHDQLGRPYLYVAEKEGGLKIYNIENPDVPLPMAAIPITDMRMLHVMNLSQSGSFLYLALGNHFAAGQSPGVAIVNVSVPVSAFLMDVWQDTTADGGSAVVLADGDYAYLGAMKHGLFILDVSDKTRIALSSRYKPDLYFPDPTPDPLKINARGMAMRGDLIYLCYDAGGLRMINVRDKENPFEAGRFANPALNGKPRAYNNVVLDDTLAYVAVDFCGLEVLSVADPARPSLVSWWNPWHCEENPLNWFTSPGHANEISYDRGWRSVFLSTGKSDLHVVNVSDPSHPDSCTIYGGVDNGIGTWGVSTYGNLIFLSYVCAAFPFQSNWTGVKILSYDAPPTTVPPLPVSPRLRVWPQPASERLFISGDFPAGQERMDVSCFDMLGRRIDIGTPVISGTAMTVDISGLAPGLHLLTVYSAGTALRKTFLKSGE